MGTLAAFTYNMNMPSILKSISRKYREDESEYQCEFAHELF